MNELPQLVIWLISDHLNYEDVRNLRLTCKRLKEAIDQKRFDSLHLFVGEYPFERDLFGINDLVNYSNTLRIDSLGILSSAKFKRQFSGLTKLTLYFDTYRGPDQPEWVNLNVNLNDLNSFVHLLHLEVLGLDLENGKLALPNLKIASFDNDKFHSPDFELHCPQLNALCLAKGTLPKLTHETRRSIRHLFMYVHRVNVLDPPYRVYELGLYEQLTNLSTVSFLDSEQAERFVRDLVDRKVCVPSLQRIQVKNARRYNARSLESFILFKKRKETKHIEFQINWKVIDLDGLIQVRDMIRRLDPVPRFGESEIRVSQYAHGNIKHWAENSNFDDLLPSETSLFLRNIEDAPFYRQLIGRLNHLNLIQIDKGIVLDEDLFEALLRKGRRIRSLIIRYNCLTQQQLDRMPGYLINLRELIFEPDADQSEMNFDFVVKFNLSSITFGFNISKETMSLILERFKCDPNFRLNIDGYEHTDISISSQRNGRIEINREQALVSGGRPKEYQVKREFDSLEAAIDFYYETDVFYNTPYNVIWS